MSIIALFFFEKELVSTSTKINAEAKLWIYYLKKNLKLFSKRALKIFDFL